MSLGKRLLDLRKSKQLSQEEVAEILDVSRQTISKWETDQSTPDFDKIVPLCELYGITSDELLTGERKEDLNNSNALEFNMTPKEIRKKKAQGIGLGILLYFIAIAWIMISIPVFRFNPVVSSAVFLLICGIATYIIVYTCIIYKKEKEQESSKAKLKKQINGVISSIILIIYLLVSFWTMAWHITWLIWIVYGLITQILKLIFMLGGSGDEK